MRRDVRAPVLGLGAVLLAACVGQIGDGSSDGTGGGPPLATSDAGRVTIHRLNRAEYDNTVRDLLGTKKTPAVDFPADDFAFGFDNMADTLTLSPVQLELYERTAQDLIDEAMTTAVPSTTKRYEAETIGGSVGVAEGNAWNLYSNGDIQVSVPFPAAGDYKVRVRAWQTPAPPDPAQMTLKVGPKSFVFQVTGDAMNPMIFEESVTMAAGQSVVSVSFDNDYVDPVTMADRNLLVDYIEVEGPIGAATKNPLRDRIVTCDVATGKDGCLREILQGFGDRAWRRPLASSEIDDLMKLVGIARAQGDSDDIGLRVALRAILLHPSFLYRVELDADPTSLASHPLGDFELASRLSYFLWSSMPDQLLFDEARAGTLHQDATLDAEVDRMLADPKSRAMVENFAGQWLYTREIADHQADYTLFPSYDADLAAAMKAEADLFFDELLKSDALGIENLLSADFTYVNDRLAKHYGLPLPGSATPVRVKLATPQRGGVLRQASLLTVTSNPDRTSPVKRGKWILTNLLCSQPPDPPPNVPPIKKGDLAGKTLREVLEEHRKNPVCASCHSTMDPLGLSLENYDAIGAWRTKDNGLPIDASGQMPDGSKFTDGTGMAAMVAKDPRFPACVAKKMTTYAIGRGLGASDAPFLQDMTKAFLDKGGKLRELVKLVVKSELFRTRRGESGGAQ